SAPPRRSRPSRRRRPPPPSARRPAAAPRAPAPKPESRSRQHQGWRRSNTARGYGAPRSKVTGAGTPPALDVVVEVELDRVGPEAYLSDLFLPLVLEMHLERVTGEHVALEQKLVVCLEGA